MSTPNDNTAPRGFSGWWQDPPRTGMRRLINPVAYRHPRAAAIAHIVGGSVAIVPAAICLGYGVWGWAAFFLAIAALNFGAGAWYLSILRSTTARA
jgi:hypothetical protein